MGGFFYAARSFYTLNATNVDVVEVTVSLVFPLGLEEKIRLIFM